MKRWTRLIGALATLLPVALLSGCSMLYSTRKLPVPKAPLVTQTVSAEELVAQLNNRWDALDSLNATVEIQASVLKSKEGVAKDYSTFRGIILMRKPGLLRVFGRLPVIGTRMFDMVSDGKDFTLYVPHYNKAYKGSNKMKRKSASMLENMRPGFFFDAMVVHGLEPDDKYMVTADTVTIEDAAKKHLYLVPEYILSVMRQKPGKQELTPVRVVFFHRDDLEPYEQDLYDSEGNLETQVLYANYRDFDGTRYPATITIKRPLEEYQMVLKVDTLKENQSLTDEEFQIKIPEGTETQKLE